MLKASKYNSLEIIESSSIMLSNEGMILFSSFNFKLMEIIECKSSLRNQCPQGWLITQAKQLEKDNPL
jgi:hypothetical protein